MPKAAGNAILRIVVQKDDCIVFTVFSVTRITDGDVLFAYYTLLFTRHPTQRFVKRGNASAGI